MSNIDVIRMIQNALEEEGSVMLTSAGIDILREEGFTFTTNDIEYAV